MTKVSTDVILEWLKKRVEEKKPIPQEAWSDAAFKLLSLLDDEHTELEALRSVVSNKKLSLLKGQDKKNVAAAELEIAASEEYHEMRLQEHRVDRIEEFIKLAKKQMSNY